MVKAGKQRKASLLKNTKQKQTKTCMNPKKRKTKTKLSTVENHVTPFQYEGRQCIKQTNRPMRVLQNAKRVRAIVVICRFGICTVERTLSNNKPNRTINVRTHTGKGRTGEKNWERPGGVDAALVRQHGVRIRRQRAEPSACARHARWAIWTSGVACNATTENAHARSGWE